MTLEDAPLEGPARWSTRPGVGPSLCRVCGEKPPEVSRQVCFDCRAMAEQEARLSRKDSLRNRPCAQEGCSEPRRETPSQIIAYCTVHYRERARNREAVKRRAAGVPLKVKEAPVAIPEGMWWCQTCETIRPEGDFHLRDDRLARTCKECKLARATLRSQDSDVRARMNESARWSQIKQKYGLDRQAFMAMLAKQGGMCAVCRKVLDPTVLRSIHVDHDHACCSTKRTCGKCVRGLLCNTCNIRLHDGIDLHWMLQAIAYLDLDRQP